MRVVDHAVDPDARGTAIPKMTSAPPITVAMARRQLLMSRRYRRDRAQIELTSVTIASRRRPRRVGDRQVDGDRLTGAAFELEPAVAVERERELAGEESAHGLTEEVAPPAGCESGVGIGAEERSQVGASRQQRRVDPQVAAELAEPRRNEGDGRALVAHDVVAARRPGVVRSLAAPLDGGEELFAEPAAHDPFVDAAHPAQLLGGLG